MFLRFWAKMVFDALSTGLKFRPINTRIAYLSVSCQFCKFLGGTLSNCNLRLMARTLECSTEDRAAFEVMRTASPKQVADYMKSLVDRKVSPTTISHRLKSLFAVFRFLVAGGIRADNPADQPWLNTKSTTQRRPNRAISVDEVRRLLAAPDLATREGIRDRAMLALFFCVGARRSEVAGLTLADLIDGDPMRVIFRATKTKKDRETLLPAQASNALVNLLTQRLGENAKQGDPMFANYYHRTGGGLSVEQINRIFKRYAKQVGIRARISTHCGRHTVVTRLLAADVPMKAVSEFVGHASTISTMRYQTLVDQDRSPIPKILEY